MSDFIVPGFDAQRVARMTEIIASTGNVDTRSVLEGVLSLVAGNPNMFISGVRAGMDAADDALRTAKYNGPEDNVSRALNPEDPHERGRNPTVDSDFVLASVLGKCVGAVLRTQGIRDGKLRHQMQISRSPLR